ncbi:hypothetical protein BLOT_008878 [Blomia tropicalis]|nr:hypothetical protein BLOT_008878 [Blomia tropicalis]
MWPLANEIKQDDDDEEDEWRTASKRRRSNWPKPFLEMIRFGSVMACLLACPFHIQCLAFQYFACYITLY